MVLGQLHWCHICRCGWIEKWATLTCMKTIIALLLVLAVSGALALAEHQGLPQEPRAREYWIDPTTGLNVGGEGQWQRRELEKGRQVLSRPSTRWLP